MHGTRCRQELSRAGNDNFPHKEPDIQGLQMTTMLRRNDNCTESLDPEGKSGRACAGSRTVADGTLLPTAGRRSGLASRPGPQASTRTSPRQVKSAPHSTGAGLTPGLEPRVDTARCPPRTNKGTAPGMGRPWAGHREGGTVARARAARATVELALRAARQPDEGVPTCRRRAALPEGSVMGRVGPTCRRFVRYYRNRVCQGRFSRTPGKGDSCEIAERGWLFQRSSPRSHTGAGCLIHCFAAQDSYSGALGAQISDGAYIPTWSFTTQVILYVRFVPMFASPASPLAPWRRPFSWSRMRSPA
jgi:hypothetical protein